MRWEPGVGQVGVYTWVGALKRMRKGHRTKTTLSLPVSLLPTGDSQSLLEVEMGKATSNVSRKPKEETEAIDHSALDPKPTNP